MGGMFSLDLAAVSVVTGDFTMQDELDDWIVTFVAHPGSHFSLHQLLDSKKFGTNTT